MGLFNITLRTSPSPKEKFEQSSRETEKLPAKPSHLSAEVEQCVLGELSLGRPVEECLRAGQLEWGGTMLGKGACS